MKRGLHPCLIFCLLLACISAKAAELTGVDLRYATDSNPAKAEFDRDKEAVSSVLVRLTGNLFATEPLSTEVIRGGLSFNASGSFEHNIDNEALGESRYRVSVDWFRELRKSTASPFFRASLALGYLDSETQRRDGPILDASTSVNFQPTNFFDTTLGLQSEIRDADTDVFDTSKLTVFLTANFSPTPRIVFRTGFRFVTGDEVSSATPTVNIVNNAQIIEPDEAFGGAEADRFAYLINASSAIAEAGIGYSLTGNIQANLLYRFVTTDADGDISYDRELLEFTIGIDL